MASQQLRKHLLTLLVTATILLFLYRLVNPVPHGYSIIAITTFLTLLIFTDIEAIRRLNPHEINLTQKKSYMLTGRSVLATTILAGLLVAILLTASGTVLTAVTTYAGHTSYSVDILQQAVHRITGLTTLNTLPLGATYLLLTAILSTGFWLLYPYIPIQNEEYAAPLTFVTAWLYLLAGITLLLGPHTLPALPTLVIDAAIIAVWGKTFAVLYEQVQARL